MNIAWYEPMVKKRYAELKNKTKLSYEEKEEFKGLQFVRGGLLGIKTALVLGPILGIIMLIMLS